MVMEFKSKKKESEMERVMEIGKERQVARIIYYGMFSAGILLIAYSGDIQSPLHQGLAVTLITTALYRLNTMREEEKVQQEQLPTLR